MKKIFLPIVIAVSVIIGVWIGNILAERSTHSIMDEPGTVYAGSKVDMLLRLIDRQYVDTVNIDSIEEAVFPKILSELDPHSSYIPADELQMVNDDLSSSFSGIGIQFNIQQDSITIIQVIRGGPSESLGLQPGDRIVEVDDTAFVGKGVTSDKVVKKLRGPSGTQVKVGVKRSGVEELLHYTITRGSVPTNSVDVAYMLEDKVGYVKISKFGSATYEEFFNALVILKREGAESFVVDLRENSGGYLESAILMINELLRKGDLIVYTEGKAQKRNDAYADGNGNFQNDPLVVLIDQWSASASEIFAGAMQDNDRAVIVGRRSFGKGLVQQQIPLRDGSAIRLTIARYYTPSGRCIQKPYSAGVDKYEEEVFNRYKSGELSSDTVQAVNDTLKYYTKKGRVVYGGGGITPDVFVPLDTMDKYSLALHNKSVLYEYAFRYTDQNRSKLSSFENYDALALYLDKQEAVLMDGVARYAETKGVKRPVAVDVLSRRRIHRLLKSYIVRNIFGDEGFYPIYNQEDPVIKVALGQLKK